MERDTMEKTGINLAAAVDSWTKGKFTMRSGFYAGRGPKSCDLNSDMLEMIYQGLKSDVGGKAPANFARFVNKLGDLSASAFIVAFEKFWQRGCAVINIRQEKQDHMRLCGRGTELVGQGLAVIGEALFGNRNSEEDIQRLSQGIKRDFVSKHAGEIPKKERREVSYW